MRKKIVLVVCLIIINSTFYMIKSQDIALPAPDKKGGMPLMEALNARHSTREFTNETLTLQQLSDLLWAGWGYNRPEEKKRTAPSSRDIQEIDIYAAMQTGLYLYDAESNMLRQTHNRDIRKFCGTQDFVATAPLDLVYVSDMGKRFKKEGDTINDGDLLSSWANTGFIAQNIYLYCASAKLGCVIRAMISRDDLTKEMGLRSNQRIILSQTIGVPVK
jgi:nitroreductase